MAEASASQGFDPLGRQLNVTARAVRGVLDAVLAEAGTTFSSWTVLAALHARGPVIQKDLARSLDMIGPSVVERIDQLEQAGLVIRSPVPQDRRASMITMTDQGRELFARLLGVMRETEASLTDGLDPHDVQTTRDVLSHMAERARALRSPGQLALHGQTELDVDGERIGEQADRRSAMSAPSVSRPRFSSAFASPRSSASLLLEVRARPARTQGRTARSRPLRRP